jgi:CspA family cold shock protein
MPVVGTVRTWIPEEGWGVIDSVETPGGCWVHFMNIETDGSYPSLQGGQQVILDWEAPGQDGYAFRAVKVRPHRAQA